MRFKIEYSGGKKSCCVVTTWKTFLTTNFLETRIGDSDFSPPINTMPKEIGNIPSLCKDFFKKLT